MMKEEFEELIGKKVTEQEYDDIETVYTFYPTLSEVEGKNQIAYLYRIHGMRIINDMLPTANKAAEYEDMIMKGKNKLELIINEFNDFKRGLK